MQINIKIPGIDGTIDRPVCKLATSHKLLPPWELFVSEKLVDDTSASVDSSLLKATGPVWHKSDMKKNLYLPGFRTLTADAKWGFSNSKGWIFGYKLHMSCSTGKLIGFRCLTDVSTANVHDSPNV